MMGKAPQGENKVRAHGLTLDNRQRATMTGVNEVVSFDEQTVVLTTEGGEITLNGAGLHVSRLTLDEGQLVVEGRIDGIQYGDTRGARRGFLRKALK